MEEDIKDKIINIVMKIPKGRVMTYGDIARLAGIRDARLVGRAISGNKRPEIPCHRVVKADGSLAVNYTKGDWKEDKEKLMSEGVNFKSEYLVDLGVYRLRV